MRSRRGKRETAKSNVYGRIIACLCVFVVLLFFSVIFSLINSTNDKIIGGIKVENIKISGLTSKEATAKIQEWYNTTVLKSIKLTYQDIEEDINPEEFNIEEDISKVIDQAAKRGRSGNIIVDNYVILYTLIFKKNLKLDLTYDDEKLNLRIDEISRKLPDAMIETNYYIEDEELIIKKGQAGTEVEKDKLKDEIIKRIKQEDKIIEIPVKTANPKKIDVEEIQKEIYKEEQSAYITENPTTVHPHINGVDFAITIEEAKEIVAEDLEEYIIPLKITVPEKTTYDMGALAFPDLLSEFTTRYDASNKNRSNNLNLAAQKINETIVNPGEIFSYNKTVGQRTIAQGYKEAAVYAGGKVVQGIGGGICQLSSTIYDAALYANLEITQRSNHRFLTSYVQAGRDATVSWGTIDLCFKNTREYPIKITSTVSNGLVKVQIYGMKEEKEYQVVLETNILEEIDNKVRYVNDSTLYEGTEIVEQYGSKGAKSETYKIVKLNGETISRTLLSVDTYSSLERIIRKGTKKVPDGYEPEDQEQTIFDNEGDRLSAILNGDFMDN